jgi:AcrR family transcriptional regulator
MAHIATRAGVHRTTVYSYFKNRDEVLAASYVRAADVVLDSAQACWDADKSFVDRLIDACVVGIDIARNIPVMKMLISRNELPHTQTVAAASLAWPARLREALGDRLTSAAAAGEIRTDVPPEQLAHWIVRICISLTVEPAHADEGGDIGVLQAYLPRCLAP